APIEEAPAGAHAVPEQAAEEAHAGAAEVQPAEAVPVEAAETSLAPEPAAQDMAETPSAEAPETGDLAASAGAATHSSHPARNLTEGNGNRAAAEVGQSVGAARG